MASTEIILSKKEVDDLSFLEDRIEKALTLATTASITISTSLKTIHDQRLYRDYGSFDDYCRERWQKGRQWGYQLIEAARVLDNLSSDENVRNRVQMLPSNESQIRPLTRLKPEQQPVAWTRAVESANSESVPVTTKHVERAVREVVSSSEISLVTIRKDAPNKSIITVDQWEAMKEDDREAIILSPRSSSFRMNQTNDNVEWAMWTWNPITGCLHNCTYCYARDIANRFYAQGFEPVFHPSRLDGPKNTPVPERAKTEIGYGNVFTCSMADLFGKWVPQGWIDATLQVMREQDQWTYLVLTKFPQRLSEQDWPENTWVGASIDRQARVKETLKCFDKVKARSNAGITWLSLEPLLEPLKFDSLAMFDMVVIGGASASTLTPEWMPPAGWIAEIMNRAAKDGVAVYLKTNGRPREYPGSKPADSIKAPAEFGLVQIT